MVKSPLDKSISVPSIVILSILTPPSAVTSPKVTLASEVTSWFIVELSSTVSVLDAPLYVSVPLFPSPIVNDSFIVKVFSCPAAANITFCPSLTVKSSFKVKVLSAAKSIVPAPVDVVRLPANVNILPPKLALA